MATIVSTARDGDRQGAVPVKVYSADSRPPLWVHLREAFARRELLFALVERDLKVRYKQTLLGALWALLPPVIFMIVFNLFLGRMGRSLSEGFPYPIFAYSGLVFWNYFSSVVSAATMSMGTHHALISKIAFPREILAWAPILSQGVDLAIACIVLSVLLGVYGIDVAWTAILIVPLFLTQVIFMAGIALIFASFNAYYRDLRYLVPLLLQVWMFVSPVAYSTRVLPEALRRSYAVLNPMAPLINGYRQVLLKGEALSAGYLATLLGGALLFMLVCYAIFKRVDRNVADVV